MGRADMSTKPWWENHSPAEMSVDCSGQKHLVRWQDGSLVLLDHNDPEGERTLAALGGDECECVEILGSWERHRDDLRLLVLASRAPSDPIIHIDELGSAGISSPFFMGGSSPMRSTRTRFSSASGWVGHSPLARARGGLAHLAGVADPDELVTLLQLGGGLSDRLVATVLAEWTERISSKDERCEAERPSLTVALYGRVTMALRAWLNEPDLAITLDMIDPRDQPDVTRGPKVFTSGCHSAGSSTFGREACQSSWVDLRHSCSMPRTNGNGCLQSAPISVISVL